MSEKKPIPIPITTLYLQQLVAIETEKSQDPKEGIRRTQRIKLLRLQIQTFQESPVLMASQARMEYVQETYETPKGKKQITEEGFRQIVTGYNSQVEGIIGKVHTHEEEEQNKKPAVRRDKQIQEKPGLPPPGTTRVEVVSEDRHMAVNVKRLGHVILDNLSEDIIHTVVLLQGREKTELDIKNLAIALHHFQRRNFRIPGIDDYLDRSQERSFSFTVATLRAVIAGEMIPGGVMRRNTKELMVKIGGAIQDLAHFQGQASVLQGLNALSVLERTIFERYMTSHIQDILGYFDVYKCTEQELAEFIALTSSHIGPNHEFIRQQENRVRLVELLEDSLDRATIDRKFELRNVISHLLQDEDAREILSVIETITEVDEAYMIAVNFFQAHEATAGRALKIIRKMQGA